MVEYLFGTSLGAYDWRSIVSEIKQTPVLPNNDPRRPGGPDGNTPTPVNYRPKQK